MKRLLAPLLAAYLAFAPAFAGQMSLLGAGKAGGAALPSAAYVTEVTPTVGGGGMVLTANGTATGAAGFTVVIITDVGSSSTDYSCTIGGLSTTQLVAATISTTITFVGVTTPGGSQNIICTATNGTGPNVALFDVYTVANLSSTTPTGTCNNNGTTTALTCTTGLNSSAGGVIIAGSMQFSNASTCPASCSYSGTETYTNDQPPHPGGFGQGILAHASGISAATPNSVTFTWNASAAAGIAAVALR